MKYGFDEWRGYSASQWRNDLTWRIYDYIHKVVRATHSTARKLVKLFDIQKKLNLKAILDRVYIIHLPDRVDRFKKVKSRLSKVKLTTNETLFDYVEFVDGVYGSTIPEEGNDILYSDYSFANHWNVDPTPKWNFLPGKEELMLQLSEAERGVTQAHHNVWKQFLETGEQSALILEDDIELAVGFNKKLEKVFKEAPADWDLIYLSSLPCETGFTWEEHSENLVRVYNGVWWLSGYAISRRFAKRLLGSGKIDGPVDLWINYMFDGANIFLTPTSLIDQADDTASGNSYSYANSFY